MFFAGMIIICGIVLLIITPNYRFSRRVYTFLFILFIGALCVIAFQKEPPISWDLYRHHLWLDNIRYRHISIVDLLRGNLGVYIGAYSDNYYMFNLIRFLIARLSNENGWLETICVFVDYCIVFWILGDWGDKHSFRNIDYVLSILLTNSIMLFVFAYSGLRNVLASCICAFGLYLTLVNGYKTVIFIVFFIIAASIHPSVLIALPFYFLCRIDPSIKGLVVTFAFPMLLRIIASFFRNSANRYLLMLGNQYMKYGYGRDLKIPILYFVIDVVFLLFFLLCYFSSDKENDVSIPEDRIIIFFVWYAFYLLGNFGSPELVTRPAYLMGACAPVFVTFFNRKVSCSMSLSFGYFLLIGLLIYDNFRNILWFVNA